MGASFTMPLKEVMAFQHDTGSGLRIGLDDYPIFDEAYRDGLNRKIVEHFWNREIAHDSISVFTFALRRKMHEIMPLYNQVYKTTLQELDWLSTVDLGTDRDDKTSETAKGTSSGESKVTSNGNSFVVNSDTPQTMLSEDEEYASGGTETQSDSGSDTTNSGESETDSSGELIGTSRTKGYQGSPADLLLKFRATILNVDMLVMSDLDECFFGLWGSGLRRQQGPGFILMGIGYRMGYYPW